MSPAVPPAPGPEPRWLNETEMQAWRSFINASQRLVEVLNRELVEAHGLTIDDYRILVLLSEAPEQALRMSQLADGIVASRSRLTHQIRRLEQLGVVRREDCPSDGRGVMAVLSDLGRHRLASMAPTHVAGVRRHLIDHLSPGEQRTLTEVFSRVDTELAAG